MNKLIFGNLIHRPLRSVISAFAVAIEVIMILSMVGHLLRHSQRQPHADQRRWHGYGRAPRRLHRSAQQQFGLRRRPDRAMFSALFPTYRSWRPVNIKLNLGSSVENIFGIDFASYNDLRPFVFVSGGPFQNKYDMIIDDLQAAGAKPQGRRHRQEPQPHLHHLWHRRARQRQPQIHPARHHG